MPTLLQFAILFNLFGTGLALGFSGLVLSKRPMPFFRWWAFSYMLGLFTAAAGLLISVTGASLTLAAIQSGLATGAFWYQLRAISALAERPFPRVTAGLVSVSLFGLAILFGALGWGYNLMLAPLSIGLSLTFIATGWLMVATGRRANTPGMAYMGIPMVARGAFIVAYPLLQGTPYLWVGFGTDALLEIAVGISMMLFVLYGIVAELEDRNRAQAETERALLQAQAERDRRNEELAAEKAILDAMLNHVPVAIFYLDRELRVRWYSQAYQRFARVPSPIGERIHIVMPGMPDPNPRLDAVLASGEIMTVTGLPFVYGEEKLVFDVTYVPIHDEAGRVTGVLMVCIDTTVRTENDRMQREQIERLREFDRLKTTFLNTVSHELRTPLASIIGYVEFLEDRVAGPLTDEQAQFIAQIAEGTLRLRRIVDDLIDFARLEAGTLRLVLRPTDLRALLLAEAVSLKPLAHAKRIDVAVQVPAGDWQVEADARRIGQVVLNLLGNALKFTPAGGQVTVAASRLEREVRVAVRDNGPGIAAADRPRIFEKFFQVNGDMNREHGGAGLGLAIARSLVEAHGGRIGIDDHEGPGSTFWFTLPAKSAGVTSPGEAPN